MARGDTLLINWPHVIRRFSINAMYECARVYTVVSDLQFEHWLHIHVQLLSTKTNIKNKTVKLLCHFTMFKLTL